MTLCRNSLLRAGWLCEDRHDEHRPGTRARYAQRNENARVGGGRGDPTRALFRGDSERISLVFGETRPWARPGIRWARATAWATPCGANLGEGDRGRRLGEARWATAKQIGWANAIYQKHDPYRRPNNSEHFTQALSGTRVALTAHGNPLSTGSRVTRRETRHLARKRRAFGRARS